MHQRKVVLYIAMSLDGYIAREDGDIGWLSMVEVANEDYGYSDFVKSIDTVIMGRKTYDKVLSFGIDFPHSEKKCVVLSNSRIGKDENVEYYSGDVSTLISNIRKKEGKDIYCDGGAEVILELMKHKLIDKLIISIIPIMLGSGIRLFKSGFPEQEIKLSRSITFSSGLVQLCYDKV